MSNSVFSQTSSTLGAAGNTIKNGNHIVSYSLGEIGNGSMKGEDQSVKGGVLQGPVKCVVPVIKNLSISGLICLKPTDSRTISLSGEKQVIYQLFKNNSFTGTEILSSTDNQNISFTLNEVGDYAVKAQYTGRTCSEFMNGSVSISTIPGITVSDNLPTVCEGGNINIALSNSQAASISYKIGNNPLQQVLLTNNAGITLNTGLLKESTTFTLVSVTSLQSGCSEEINVVRELKVNAKPALIATAEEICSGKVLNITTSSSSTELIYDWTATYGSITGGRGSGAGVTLNGGIQETLFNASEEVQNILYTFKPRIVSNGVQCLGTDYTLEVRVLPTPKILKTEDQEICSGVNVEIPLTSNVAGAVISWRNQLTGISGRNIINEKLFNETGNSITNTYELNLNATGCSTNEVFQVNVVVKPKPSIKILTTNVSCSPFSNLENSIDKSNSSAGLNYTFWNNAGLTNPVNNPESVPEGLYFVKGQDNAGCFNSSRILLRSPLTFIVNQPKPFCPDQRGNLTLSEITAGSQPGLSYAYFEDESLQKLVTNPASVISGKYFIQAKDPSGCTSVKNITIKEIVSENLTLGTDNLTVCSGGTFNFDPKIKSDYTFSWARDRFESVGLNTPSSGKGVISDNFGTTETPVSVTYFYSLGIPGCNTLNNKSIKVTVLPKPSFKVLPEIEVCGVFGNLSADNVIVQSSGAYKYAYLDANGAKNVPVSNAKQVLPGKYAIEASFQGCTNSQPVEVKSKVKIPALPDTSICDPQRLNLNSLVAGIPGVQNYTIGFWRDLEQKQAILNPAQTGSGNYFISFAERTGENCSTLIPLKILSNNVSLKVDASTLEICSGSNLNIPFIENASVKYTWKLLNANDVNQSTSGIGSIQLVLSNKGFTTDTALINLIGNSIKCNESDSTILKVAVLPKPALKVDLGLDLALCADDTLKFNISDPAAGSFKYYIKAEYNGVLGGIFENGEVVNAFKFSQITENLLNVENDEKQVLYSFVPINSDIETCTGDTIYMDSYSVLGINDAACKSQINGTVATFDLRKIQEVELKISNAGNQKLGVTNSSGAFYFTGLTTNLDYTISSKLDKNPLNGVSTLDLLYLQNHLSGKSQLPNPYYLIAADANNSRNISVGDLIQIKKLILGQISRFPNNFSWRFIPKNFEFPNPKNPWQTIFPEVINLNNLKGSAKSDFIGIKIGDLTGNATANNKENSTQRQNIILNVTTDHKQLIPGKTMNIPFLPKDFEDINGLQFTIQLDLNYLKLDVSQIKEIYEDRIAVFENQGMITFSLAKPIEKDEIILELPVQVLKEGILSERLFLNSRITVAEGYQRGIAFPMELEFSNGLEELSQQPRLYPAFPNPFFESSVIAFWIPNMERVRITVFQATGQKIVEMEEILERGEHQFKLNKMMLNNDGVYFYKIETDTWSARGSLVLVSQ